jgi:hypothetical protein
MIIYTYYHDDLRVMVLVYIDLCNRSIGKKRNTTHKINQKHPQGDPRGCKLV